MKPNARNTITILEKMLKELGPEYLAYWALPNTVLTLSGARAFCDGVFWDDDNKNLLKQWEGEITRSLEVIKTHADVLWAEAAIKEPRPKEKFAGYECILTPGLRYTLNQTQLLQFITFDRLKSQPNAEAVMDLLAADLRSQNRFKDYSNETINHIAFGFLLGYPDKAIMESVTTWEKNDPFAEPHISADIRGASYYVCPQPVYSYPRHLVNDLVITVHEKFWSTILQDFYTSDFHKSLATNKNFQRKMKELGNL